MAKRPFTLILDGHHEYFYPNDLAGNLSGEKVLFLMEAGFGGTDSTYLSKLLQYTKKYTQYKKKGEINIAKKEAVWASMKEKVEGWALTEPTINSLLEEYVELTSNEEILPNELIAERKRLMYYRSPRFNVDRYKATMMREVVLCEIGLDYASEFEIIGADFRSSGAIEIANWILCLSKKGEPWTVKLDCTKVDDKYLKILIKHTDLENTVSCTDIGKSLTLKDQFVEAPKDLPVRPCRTLQ